MVVDHKEKLVIITGAIRIGPRSLVPYLTKRNFNFLGDQQ